MERTGMIVILFWVSLAVLVYAYFGYPAFMSFLIRVRKKRPVRKGPVTPRITVVISAYNEEKAIGEKIENILSLDYPRGQMEIIVVSDASTDSTDAIVKRFAPAGVKLLRMGKRSGKIVAYRKALSETDSCIIVFSDATSILERESVKNLISNFNDESVGCAGGLLMYVNPNKANVGEGESKYWMYEKKILMRESELSSLPSVSGTLYAVKKELYPLNMKPDLADDLIVPINVKKHGFRTVLEQDAVCREVTTLTIKEDMSKRARITIQNIRGLMAHADVLNPFKYGVFSVLVISHKVFRLLVPVFLLIVFFLSLGLSFVSPVYLAGFASQIVFYAGGIIGYIRMEKVKSKIINILFYFCLSNLAIFLGIIEFFKGRKVTTWETMRSC